MGESDIYEPVKLVFFWFNIPRIISQYEIGGLYNRKCFTFFREIQNLFPDPGGFFFFF